MCGWSGDSNLQISLPSQYLCAIYATISFFYSCLNSVAIAVIGWTSHSQKWVFKPAISASAENMLEMHILGPTSNGLESRCSGWWWGAGHLTSPAGDSDAH